MSGLRGAGLEPSKDRVPRHALCFAERVAFGDAAGQFRNLDESLLSREKSSTLSGGQRGKFVAFHPWLSEPLAARIVPRVCRATLYNLCKSGVLPHVRIGSSIRLALLKASSDEARRAGLAFSRTEHFHRVVVHEGGQP